MTEDQALARLTAPGTPRPGTWRDGTIQIHVTRACDNACRHCTQGSNLAGKPNVMTPDQFEAACRSLKGYPGVIGCFGGNPSLHPQFPVLCEILRAHFPFEQRGLWCNHPRGHGKLMRETFNPDVSNLNVHLSWEAFDEFRRDWPEARPFGLDRDSRHAPCFVALRDVVPDEATRWGMIARCDLNRRWSALVGVFRGGLRAWFCELAGAQSMLHQYDPGYPDTGVPAEPGWWRRPMADFAAQVRKHCHECGVPLKGRGELAVTGTGPEQVSLTHLGVARLKRKGEVRAVAAPADLGPPLARVTDYLENGA
jgi:hypothetical protein